jgi:hypothetical protein
VTKALKLRKRKKYKYMFPNVAISLASYYTDTNRDEQTLGFSTKKPALPSVPCFNNFSSQFVPQHRVGFLAVRLGAEN